MGVPAFLSNGYPYKHLLRFSVIFFRHLNDDRHHLNDDRHHLNDDHHHHHYLSDDCHQMFLLILSFWLFSYSFYDGTKVSYAKVYHSKLLLIMLLLHCLLYTSDAADD